MRRSHQAASLKLKTDGLVRGSAVTFYQGVSLMRRRDANGVKGAPGEELNAVQSDPVA